MLRKRARHALLSRSCRFAPDPLDGRPTSLGLQLAVPLFAERRFLEIAVV
jgi:hypothetical protein